MGNIESFAVAFREHTELIAEIAIVIEKQGSILIPTGERIDRIPDRLLDRLHSNRVRWERLATARWTAVEINARAWGDIMHDHATNAVRYVRGIVGGDGEEVDRMLKVLRADVNTVVSYWDGLTRWSRLSRPKEWQSFLPSLRLGWVAHTTCTLRYLERLSDPVPQEKGDGTLAQEVRSCAMLAYRFGVMLDRPNLHSWSRLVRMRDANVRAIPLVADSALDRTGVVRDMIRRAGMEEHPKLLLGRPLHRNQDPNQGIQGTRWVHVRSKRYNLAECRENWNEFDATRAHVLGAGGSGIAMLVRWKDARERLSVGADSDRVVLKIMLFRDSQDVIRGDQYVELYTHYLLDRMARTVRTGAVPLLFG